MARKRIRFTKPFSAEAIP